MLPGRQKQKTSAVNILRWGHQDFWGDARTPKMITKLAEDRIHVSNELGWASKVMSK